MNKSYTSLFTLIISTILFISKLHAQNIPAQDSVFHPSGKISGYMFGDYAYMIETDQAQRGNLQYSKLEKGYNSFDIRRLYLQYAYQFSPKISTHITLAHESSMEANPDKATLTKDGNRTVFVKHAYIQFQDAIPNATLVVGQQSTPTFSLLSESFWKYRSIEKTIADMRGISSSSDLGVGLYGKFGRDKNFGYDLLFANNSGTKFIPTKHKKIYSSVYAYFLNKKLVAQLNYEFNNTSPFTDVSGNTQLLKTFLGYKTSKSAFGVEAFAQFNRNNVRFLSLAHPKDSLIGNSTAVGISAFYIQTLLPEKLNLFARLDWFNPDSKYKADRQYLNNNYVFSKEVFATFGVDYQPIRNLHLMPNIWLNRYGNKANFTGNIPKTGYDIAGRITLYYTFNK